MELIIVPGYSEVGAVASDIVASEVARDHSLHLGVATGSSPLSLYEALVERHASTWDYSKLRVSCLDEYIGLPRESEYTYRKTVIRTVLRPLGVPEHQFTSPDVWNSAPEVAAQKFEEFLAEHPVDLQIAGIGTNGHIAFNEPNSGLLSRTRVARLSPETRAANARFFPSPDVVPHLCVTQGLGTILNSRMLLMVVSGAEKSRALASAVNGPLTAACPASIVQMHSNAVIVADEDAAREVAQAVWA